MLDNRPIYVIDTNVIVDYVDVIPGVLSNNPDEPTVDLTGAHIVIPTAVVRELSSFKKESSDRGKAARIALKRIRELVEDESLVLEGFLQDGPDVVKNEVKRRLLSAYLLEAPIEIKERDQLLSILPIHKSFKKSLPFSPSENDMDGQIILASLAVGFLTNRPSPIPIDGSAKLSQIKSFTSKNVTLLTNDNGLAIRARERGVRTQRYGYKYPEPYTGRREVVVPRELFLEFYNSQGIGREVWESFMPNQPELIANEFIVMRLENELDYPSDFDPKCNPYFCHIGKFDAEEGKIVKLKYLRNFPLPLKNDGQAIYAEALCDPEIDAVVCVGPAGSGKTFMATVYGYESCVNGDYIGVTVVPCDSGSKIGALPGDLDDKMDPDVQPLKNALRNYLLTSDSKFKKELENMYKHGNGKDKCAKDKCNKDANEDAPERKSIKARLNSRVDLIWENWFSNIPIENARGRDFAYELAIYDEFQDQTVKQADTLIKRIGKSGKIIITGDLEQIHAPYIDAASSGLVYASRELMDSPMVAQVCFTEDEVIRHPLVKMIAMRQRQKQQKTTDA